MLLRIQLGPGRRFLLKDGTGHFISQEKGQYYKGHINSRRVQKIDHSLAMDLIRAWSYKEVKND